MASLDLDAISFVVKTEQLDTAITKLEKLETSLGNLSKPLKELSKSGEDAAKPIKTLGESGEDTSKKLKGVERILELQATKMKVLRDEAIQLKDGIENLGKGFTSSQSSQLANLKILGATVDQINVLSKSFKDYNDITGVNTFDASANGLSRLNKEIRELSQVNELASKGFGLTREELKFLARDTNAMSQAFSAEGKTADELKEALSRLNNEFVQASRTRNQLIADAKLHEDTLKKEALAVAEAVRMQNDSSEAMFRNHQLRQDQDRKTHEQIMKEMRQFYLEQEKIAGVSVTSQGKPADAHVATYYKQQEKAANGAAKANDYLTREMLRAESALAGLNENMNISSSNRLLRFKEALSAAGVEAGQAALALQKYEAVLKATDTASASKKTKNRKEELEYLARATSVQLGDIGVSLAGGQNPLIVMIQQGDQLRGVLNQVGGDAKEMQAAMSSAFRQIVVGFVDVGKALGQFVTGAFVDASKAIVNFISDTTGISSFRKELELMATSSDKAIASIGRFGVVVVSAIGGAAVASVMAFTVALAAGAVAMYQLGKEQTAIAQANAQFGGAFGASTQDVISFNKELQSVGVTSSDVSVIFTEVAKAGNIGKESFVGVTKAAADFETYVGGKAADAVKVFSETIKDPVKGLTEFGVKTGYVNQEQVELVKKLIETGQGAEAQKLAIGFLEQGYMKMTTNAKAGMSSLDLSLIEAGKSLSELWDNFKNSQGVGEGFRLLWETVAVIGSEVWFTLKAVGIEIGGIGAQIAAVLRGDFSGAKTIGEQMKQDAEVAAKAQEELVKRILDRSKVQKDSNSEERKAASAKLALSKENEIVEKALAKSDKDALSRSEYQKKQLEELNKQLVNRKVTTEELARLEKKWGEDWDKAHKQKKDSTKTDAKIIEALWESISDTVNRANIAYDEVVNGADKYTASQKKMIDIINNKAFLAMPESLKQEALARLATAHATEVQTVAVKQQREEIRKAWEATVKFQGDIDKANFDLLEGLDDKSKLLDEEIYSLMAQKAIYGDLTVDQKKMIEYKKIDLAYTKEIQRIEKSKADDPSKDEAKLLAASNRDKARKMVFLADELENQKIIQAKYEEFADTIGESIYLAIFDGGKKGTDNFRKYLVAELKKPITVIINALVNTAMGTLTGGKFGSALSAGNTISNAIGLTSNTGLLGGMFSGASAYGAAIGGTTAAGSQAAMLAAQTGEFGLAGLAATTEAAGGVMASFAGAANSAMSALSAIPGWGWALAGVGMLLAGLDDSGTYHTGGGASYNAATGAVESSVGFQLNPSDVSSSAVDFAKQFTTAIGQMLDATALAFGKTAGYEIATAFADDVSSDGAWGSLVIKKGTETILDWSKTQTSRWAPKEFADGEEGKNQYLAAVAKDVRDTLINETPSWADAMLNALGSAPTIDGLTQTVTLINQTQSAFETMALASSSFTNVSDELVNSLIKATGGAANLVSGLNYYYQNFFSEEERKLVMQQQVNTEFAKFNKEVPTTREGFKTLVEAAMAAGDAELVSNLLKVAPAFAAITEASIDATKAAEEAAEEAAKALAASIKKGIDDSIQVLEKAVQKQKDLLNTQLSTVTALSNSLSGIFDLLKSNIRELYSEVSSTSSMQVQQAYSVIASAKGTGVLPSEEELSQAIGTVRGSFGSTNYASKFEADRARLLFANDLAALQGIAGEQLTEAQQQIKLLKDQIEVLDTTLEYWKDLIDTSNDTLIATKSVADAVNALSKLLFPDTKPSNTNTTVAAPTGAGGVQNDGVSSRPVATTSLGLFAQQDIRSYINNTDFSADKVNASVIQMTKDAKSLGYTQADIAAVIGWSEKDVQTFMYNAAGIPAFASGGTHTGGLRLVGENSPELEVTGPARYYNKDQFFDVLRSGFSENSNGESTEMLRAEVRSIAISTSKLQRIIDALVVPTSEGEAINVKVVV